MRRESALSFSVVLFSCDPASALLSLTSSSVSGGLGGGRVGGAAALAARNTIVTDVPMVQVGIKPCIQNTFANPVYCSIDASGGTQTEKPSVSEGIEILARRYPEAIFVISQGQAALTALLELIESEEVRPAMVIGAPAGFVDVDVAKQRLNDALVPHIRIDGRKGNAVVATAIINGLVELAWQAYGQDESVGG